MLSCHRALDLTDEKGWFCGKILADLGVEVIQVESPIESSQRSLPPFYLDKHSPENSLQWFAYGQGKKSIILDLTTPKDREKLLNLVRTASWVIESFPPGYLEDLGLAYEILNNVNPEVILVRISPFGQTGPYKNYKTSDIVALAMSGVMYSFGEPDRCPVRISTPHSQAYLQAGEEAALASVMALYYRQRTGQGQVVDVSIRESLFWCTANAGPWWELHNLVIKRAGARRVGRGHGPGFGVRHRLIWPSKDGYVAFVIFGGGMGSRINSELVKWMDEEGMADGFLRGYDWQGLDLDMTSAQELLLIERMIERFFLSHTKMELLRGALKHRVMLYPVNDIEDILNDAHLQVRKFWTNVKHPELGISLRYPGPFVRASLTPLRTGGRAPFKGEHKEEIYSKLGNLQEETAQSNKEREKIEQIFQGLKVVEFTTGAVGPIIGKYLADHGATVVHVESEVRLSSARVSAPWKGDRPHPDKSGYYALYYSSKYNLTLNLSLPKGIEVAKKVVGWADVVIENFAPGIMKRWGLDYESVVKIKPDIIMISSSNAGQNGPYSTQPAYGMHLNGLAGFSYLTGWPDREPNNPSPAYSDYVAPRLGACALIAALIYRLKTGRGQNLDHSQLEASLHFLSPSFLDFQVNGRKLCRNGNRIDNAAPHSAYRCQGEDRWCVIAVETEDQWLKLVQVMDKQDLSSDPRFSNLQSRKEHEQVLDSIIEGWTSKQTAEEVMKKLQNKGIPAGVVVTMENLYNDSQLAHRQFFRVIDHPDLGPFHYVAHPFIFSKTPCRVTRSPRLGEHTSYVLCDLLGYSAPEIAELMNEGVLN